MGLGKANSAMLAVTAALVLLTAFCYDLACSANAIRPGDGSLMMNVTMASGLMTVLAALNLTFLNRDRIFRSAAAGKGVHAPEHREAVREAKPSKPRKKPAKRARPAKKRRRGKRS